MAFTDEYGFYQFDKVTLDNPKIRTQLLDFYCDIWMHDPNFGEYRKCPICGKFFNETQVETLSINQCSGSETNPHPTMSLVAGWTPDIVWTELDSLLQKEHEFFGVVAVVPQTARIVGFVWGYAEDFITLTKRWPTSLTNELTNLYPTSKVTYFQEIAVDRSFRKFGTGTVLCRMLVNWMRDNYPNCPSYLHTHIKSPAYRLFQKAGYRLYTELSGPNSGRILMVAPSGRELTPQNLINY